MSTRIDPCALAAARRPDVLRCIFGVAGLCLGFLAQAQDGQLARDPVTRLAASRERLVPFRAIYVEQLRVFGEFPSGGGKKGWGTSDSDLEVETGVDSHASQLRYEAFDRKAGGKSLSDRFYFNAGSLTYQLVDNETRGYFAKHGSGMINPAAAGYEVAGEHAANYFRRNSYDVASRNEVRVTSKVETTVVHFTDFGAQTCIDSISQASPGWALDDHVGGGVARIQGKALSRGRHFSLSPR